MIPPFGPLSGYRVIRKTAVVCGLLLLGAFFTPSPALADQSAMDLVSTGPNGGTGVFGAVFAGVSADGNKVWFETQESLVSGDTDNAIDVYERNRTTGTTTLISTGPAGGNANVEAFFVGASKDGSHVFFETDESLVSADTDGNTDVYDRSGGSTSLVSTGPTGGNGAFGSFFAGCSDDGSRVWIQTDEPLTGADVDTTYDVYERSGGNTSLISSGTEDVPAYFEGASADSSHVFFQTDEALVFADLDNARDVYDRSGAITSLVSGGTANLPASFAGSSQDGNHVFFETDESLSPSDTDSSRDVYDRSGATSTLVSEGTADTPASFAGASQDGSRVFFHTQESLTAGDTDTARDVYERSGGNTTLVSAGGNGAFPATFVGASQDGATVFFQTDEALTAGDTDTARDVYQRSNGATKLVTPGSANLPATFAGTSIGGAHVFFETDESLDSSDTDNYRDVYEHLGNTTALISSGANGAFDASFAGASKDGTQAFFESEEPLLNPPDTDTSTDVYARSDAPYSHPIGGSPFRVPLVPAYQPCEKPGNSTHGGPLGFPSCHGPTPSSSLVSVGARSIAFSRYLVCIASTPAPPCGPLTRPDVKLASQITDARSGSPTGPDYADPSSTSDLTEVLTLRITDSDSIDGAATLVEQPFSIPMDCATTSDPTIGSTCSLNTSANALLPNVVRSGKAAVWQIGQVEVMDRGQDGIAGNSDDKVFEVQGVFVP